MRLNERNVNSNNTYFIALNNLTTFKYGFSWATFAFGIFYLIYNKLYKKSFQIATIVLSFTFFNYVLIGRYIGEDYATILNFAFSLIILLYMSNNFKNWMKESISGDFIQVDARNKREALFKAGHWRLATSPKEQWDELLS